jgi:hypothetical protein
MTFKVFSDLISTLLGFCFLLALITSPLTALIAVDYLVSADKVVNVINAQCETSYKKLDYLTVGKDVMLQLCETRQKRFEIVQ